MLNTMSYQSVFCHLHIEHTIPLITPDFLPTEDTRHSPAKKQHQKNNRLMTSPRNTEKKKKRHLGTDSQQKHYSLLPPAVTLTWAILYLRVSTLSPVVDSRPTLMATVRGEIWNPGKSGMSAKEEDNLVKADLKIRDDLNGICLDIHKLCRSKILAFPKEAVQNQK